MIVVSRILTKMSKRNVGLLLHSKQDRKITKKIQLH